MPRYDYSNMSVGLGTVTPRPIVRRNIEAFATALDKIDANSKEAIEKRSAIDLALSQIELNPAEDEWKYNYAKRIRDSIDAYARFGDYSQAVNAATTAAATAMSSPELTGRIRAQAAYKDFVDKTKARTDINQDIKDWALAQPENQYHYEDTYDSAYNIVGGSRWEAGLTPVTQVSLAEALSLVKQWAAADAGGSVTDVGFVDANGKITSDVSQGVYGMAYKKSGRWEVLPESKLREAWQAVLSSQPGLRASLQQDYDVAVWKYNQMTPEEKANSIDSDIYDTHQGRMYSPQEYLENRISPAFKAMQYSHSYSDVEFGDGWAKYASAAGAAAKNNAALYEDQIEQSKPIEYDGERLLNSVYSNLQGSIGQLRTLYPNLSRSKAFNDLIAKHDYNGLANLLSNNMTSQDPNVRENARSQIKLLKNYGNIYNRYLDKLTPDEKARFEFSTAINAHAQLPDDNPYTKAYWYNIDHAFRTGTKYATNQLGWVCESQSQFENIAKSLGIKNPSNNQEWAAKGFEHKMYNGRNVIAFNRDNRYISDLMTELMNTSGFTHATGAAVGTSGFLRYDANGNIQNKTMIGDNIQNAIVKFFGGNPDTDYRLESIYDNTNADTAGTLFGNAISFIANPIQGIGDALKTTTRLLRGTISPFIPAVNNLRPTTVGGSIQNFTGDNMRAGDLANLAKDDSPGIDFFNGYIGDVNANPVQVADSTSRMIRRAKGMDKIVEEMPIYEDSFRRMELWNKFQNGEIDKETLNVLDKRYADRDLDNVLAPGLASYIMYADGEDGIGSLKELSQEDKQNIITKLFNARTQNLLEATAGWNPLSNMYGTTFKIYSGKDKDGNYTGAPQTVFVEALGNTKSAKDFVSDTTTEARHRLTQARVLTGSIIDLDNGTQISEITNDGVTITNAEGQSMRVSFDEGVRQLRHSLNMEDAKDYMTRGIITTTEQLQALAQTIVTEDGYSPTTDNMYAGRVLEVMKEIAGSVNQ